MILEGIVTTVSDAGEPNIAPMGPHFAEGDDRFELRPFNTSQTYRNLCVNPVGVFHVTDDVLLIARCAINELGELPKTRPATRVNGFVLENCSRWFEFNANQIANDSPRKSFHCSIVAIGTGKPFYGFNRAKHAIIEATILATRIDFIPIDEIQDQFSRLQTIVEKTGGEREQKAFNLLQSFVARNVGTES